jgi:hypothetical protein
MASCVVPTRFIGTPFTLPCATCDGGMALEAPPHPPWSQVGLLRVLVKVRAPALRVELILPIPHEPADANKPQRAPIIHGEGHPGPMSAGEMAFTRML